MVPNTQPSSSSIPDQQLPGTGDSQPVAPSLPLQNTETFLSGSFGSEGVPPSHFFKILQGIGPDIWNGQWPHDLPQDMLDILDSRVNGEFIHGPPLYVDTPRAPSTLSNVGYDHSLGLSHSFSTSYPAYKTYPDPVGGQNLSISTYANSAGSTIVPVPEISGTRDNSQNTPETQKSTNPSTSPGTIHNMTTYTTDISKYPYVITVDLDSEINKISSQCETERYTFDFKNERNLGYFSGKLTEVLKNHDIAVDHKEKGTSNSSQQNLKPLDFSWELWRLRSWDDELIESDEAFINYMMKKKSRTGRFILVTAN
ncbi:hypothetical protein ABW20_dc0102204 [Dactylellina cionopaga]|nr:hypothetical protein ABW20_dc0102204 [Dactylellina cionopaga]